ncbi:YkvA family protein [Pontibacter sp. CAU 1760]
MTQLHTLKQRTHTTNTELYALYLAYRDSRVAWYVRVLLALSIGYALSPVDLVPDLTAVFGYIDDVVIVAAGFSISYHLLTKPVRQEARLHAYETMSDATETSGDALRVIMFAWLLLGTLLVLFGYKLLHLHML